MQVEIWIIDSRYTTEKVLIAAHVLRKRPRLRDLEPLCPEPCFTGDHTPLTADLCRTTRIAENYQTETLYRVVATFFWGGLDVRNKKSTLLFANHIVNP